MEIILSFVEANIVWFMAGVLALLILFCILLVMNLVKFKKLRRRYEAFMQGQDGKALEYVLADCAEKVNLNQDEVQNLKRYVAGTVERKVNNSLYKSKMLRYNAFEGMGGDLSFVWVLLDDGNNGYILNNIHNREGGYMYAKIVKEGNCEQRLSPVEEQVLRDVVAQRL